MPGHSFFLLHSCDISCDLDAFWYCCGFLLLKSICPRFVMHFVFLHGGHIRAMLGALDKVLYLGFQKIAVQG
jgi:hypothetical protein